MGDKKSERDARLAKALRENLRRRKVGAGPNHKAIIPAKAGTSGRPAETFRPEVPAFAGTTGFLVPPRLRLPAPQILAQGLGQPLLPLLVALRHGPP